MASDIAGQIAFLNGRFIPAAECRLPIYDTGIVLSAAALIRLCRSSGRSTWRNNSLRITTRSILRANWGWSST